MSRLLSPRDLAEALGVSESSLKRWIDAGRIRASRTEGGHRRIALEDALAFVRQSKAAVVRPELLDLPVRPAPARARELASADDRELTRALHDGDAGAIAGVLHAHHAAGQRLDLLCDGPIRRAMEAAGELWLDDPDGVLIEHRATDACYQALGSLRASIRAPADAPVALGGAPEDDPYVLASAMAALVLAAEGFRTVNLGPDTPISALHRAVAIHQPAMVWLSVSAPLSLAHAHALAAFVVGLPAGVIGIAGGRHAHTVAAADPRVQLASSMAELAQRARLLRR